MNRTRPARAGDAALLLARLLLGVIMFAHGYQKLMVDGLGRTSQGFERMSIPVAIVSASFVTVVEIVGALLLVVGLLTTVAAGLMGVVMVGAAAYVHAPHGVFVADGGWELVGAIGGGLLALAAAGPGRISVEHLLRVRRHRAPMPGPPIPTPAVATSGLGRPPEPIPPAGLPVTPLIRFTPPVPGALPEHRRR